MNTHTRKQLQCWKHNHLLPNQGHRQQKGRNDRQDEVHKSFHLPIFPRPGKDELGARGFRSETNEGKNITVPEKTTHFSTVLGY